MWVDGGALLVVGARATAFSLYAHIRLVVFPDLSFLVADIGRRCGDHPGLSCGNTLLPLGSYIGPRGIDVAGWSHTGSRVSCRGRGAFAVTG